MSLWSRFLTNNRRFIHKWTHYFPAYERHFAPFINKSILILEIGVEGGGSLQMWKGYFGPHARIVGIDINPHCKGAEEDQIAVRIGDQSDPAFLQSILDEFGTPDIVIDDGSHVQKDIKASFAYLYPRMAKNGVYLVEDLHCAYLDDYGGGVKRAGTFIELCKDLVDDLNRDEAAKLEPVEFTKTTLSMHFYDSIVVFERGHAHKRSFQIGGAVKPR